MSNQSSTHFAVSFFTSVLTSALVTLGVLYFTGNLPILNNRTEPAPVKEEAPPAEVAAPALKGLTTEIAGDVLKSRGLRLVVQEERPDNQIPAGQICGQDPLPDSVLPVGGAVSVAVSTGPDSVVVPDIAGKPIEEARRMLIEAGLVIGTMNESGSGAAGTAVETVPPQGTQQARGTVVNLTVTGSATVPKVVGTYLGKGKKLLTEAGFKVGKLKWRYSDDYDSNVILSQEPEADAIVAPGTEIILTVNPD